MGLDVYGKKASLFFENHLNEILGNKVLIRLVSFPNVLPTSHQGFFTEEALTQIAQIALANVTAFQSGQGELFAVQV